MLKSPEIDCPELPAFDRTDLNAVVRAFAIAPATTMQQAWLIGATPDFVPAVVRAGWRNNTLLVLAELNDADIFSFATHPNERLWELGDTLEIFLRPSDQPSYGEFQIAPNNQKLQLRFANAAAVELARKHKTFAEALVHEINFHSQTWVFPNDRCWHALVEIPAGAMSDASASIQGSTWHFSFCRYDYTRGQSEPVISSTSAHSQPDFHRLAEWGIMHFR